MKRISILATDLAWEILRDYQEENNISTRDEAASRLIEEFKKLREGKQ